MGRIEAADADDRFGDDGDDLKSFGNASTAPTKRPEQPYSNRAYRGGQSAGVRGFAKDPKAGKF